MITLKKSKGKQQEKKITNALVMSFPGYHRGIEGMNLFCMGKPEDMALNQEILVLL